MITGKQFAEDQKLYSTGNDELDDLLERAFCEGYELAQREFAEKEDKDKDEEDEPKKKSLGKKIAVGAGIGAGVAGATYGASKLIQRKLGKDIIKAGELLNSGNLDEKQREALSNKLTKLYKKDRIAKVVTNPVDKLGKKMSDSISKGTMKKVEKMVKKTKKK